MKIILPFSMFKSACMASAKNDVRYYLNAIHIASNRIEASDGRVAYMATKFRELIPDSLGDFDRKINLILNVKSKIPKSTKVKNIQYVIIEDTMEESNGKISISYTDRIGVVLDMGYGERVDAKYPDLQKLIRDRISEREVIQKCGFNAQILGMIPKIIDSNTLQDNYIEFDMLSANKSAIVRLNRFNHLHLGIKEYVLAMPIRL